MKKILISVLTIALVGGAAFGASRAFFSDTETSTGNTFTAGSLDLKIDSTAHYLDMVCTPGDGGNVWTTESQTPIRPELVGKPCDGTFTLTDLDAEKFFNFTDVKPGDYGEDTISMHIVNNDAWACIDVGKVTTNGTTGDALAAGLNFFAWADLNGDNIFQPADSEYKLFTNTVGPLVDVLNGKTYALADSTTGFGPFEGGPLDDETKTRYIGLAWCAGTLTVNPDTGVMNCDGSALGNEAQNGSVSADLTFRVEQSRNNSEFTCVKPIRVESVPLNFSSTGWGGWSCPAGTHVVNGGYTPAEHVVTVSQPAKPGEGTYPVYPHYTYTPPEQGWVVQNGGDPATLTIWVDCMPN